ncbi:paraplegin [Culex quinquefasciatus]|uniref:Paraplegin n=1 Tax=Culex quinquefasciatus TaxID=7176 RepID=B0XDI0_CULQU|nr:paraplegin [Culex quinquefasciatus]|eukprot:XP_001867702.1 paraplegin [Culex quinquefasciatus]
MDSFTQMERVKFTPVDPVDEGQGVFFKDVACLQETKQEMKFVELKAPDRLGQGFLKVLYHWVHLSVLAKAVAIQAQASTSSPYFLPGVYTRSPWSQRAAYAGGLAQNSTARCSGEPGKATGVVLRAITVGAPETSSTPVQFQFQKTPLTSQTRQQPPVAEAPVQPDLAVEAAVRRDLAAVKSPPGLSRCEESAGT